MIKEGDRVTGWGSDRGKIIGIEDDVAYILMDNPEAVIEGDDGVEIVLLSDIGEASTEADSDFSSDKSDKTFDDLDTKMTRGNEFPVKSPFLKENKKTFTGNSVIDVTLVIKVLS